MISGILQHKIMSKPKPAPLPSGTVVGGYQIVKKIAAGGFGIVYLAEDETRHLVALNEYLPASLADRLGLKMAPPEAVVGRRGEGPDLS